MSITYSYEELAKLLGVKAPVLMLDRLETDAPAGTAEGIRQITMNDPIFLGHFPGTPVMPGVLQVAGMIQAAKTLHMEIFPGEGTLVAVALRRVKFRTPVVPGMTLRYTCRLNGEPADGRAEYELKNFVGDDVASSGYVTLERKDENWFAPIADTVPDFVSAMPEGTKNMGSEEIMDVIPHRYPFMLVDGAYGCEDISGVVGYKNICGSDPLVNAISPNCFSGVFQVEAGAQLGCVALLSQPENKGMLGFFMSIDNAEFYRAVLPGERLYMKMACEPHGKFGVATGEFYVGNEKVAVSAIKFAVVPR